MLYFEKVAKDRADFASPSLWTVLYTIVTINHSYKKLHILIKKREFPMQKLLRLSME